MLVELASNWLGLIDNILYIKCNEKATNACLDLTYSLYGNFSSFLVENFAGTCWTEDRWLIHQRDLTTGQLRVTATIVTKEIIKLRLHEQNRTHEGWSSCAFSLFRSWFYVSCVSLRYYYSLEFRKEISYHSSPRLWRGTLNSSLPSLFNTMGKENIFFLSKQHLTVWQFTQWNIFLAQSFLDQIKSSAAFRQNLS